VGTGSQLHTWFKNIKRTLEETVGYLTKDGTPLKNETYWVFPENVEEVYGNLLAQYGNPSLDPVIEEPYVKTLITVDLLNRKLMLYYAEVNKIKPDKNKVKEEVKKVIDEVKKDNAKLQQIKAQYGSLTNYEKELTRQKEEELTIQAVKDKLGMVADKEVQDYYNKNKQDIINKYTKAETSYVTFSTKEEMEKVRQIRNGKRCNSSCIRSIFDNDRLHFEQRHTSQRA